MVKPKKQQTISLPTKIAFGGGCHWCTEAVFQALLGVVKVEQGWIASTGSNNSLSEAVIVHFHSKEIPLKTLTEIHLRTHKSTSQHSMRSKYRSAVYFFSEMQADETRLILKALQQDFDEEIITQVLPFKSFKPSNAEITNYYQKDANKPFCKTYIDPKLELLRKEYSTYFNSAFGKPLVFNGR